MRFTEADKQNNALARRRALAQAIKEEERCRADYEAAQSEDGRVESELRQAQTASLKLSESLANLKGQSESARRDADASARALKQLEGEHQRLLAEQEENTAFFEKAQPDSDELERTLSQVTADLELNKEKVPSWRKHFLRCVAKSSLFPSAERCSPRNGSSLRATCYTESNGIHPQAGDICIFT